jgi:CDP-2,3-bis-(O-geranylgeranyl)-sn-glycerol synthase
MNPSPLTSALSIIVPSGLINISLNLFWETKRKYHLEKYDVHFDFDKKFKSGKPIIGTSTTWGGLLVAVLLGLLIDVLFPHTFHGLLISFCVFFGHALGSFIKRRLGIPRGQYLPIVDHGDYIILATLAFYLLHYINPIVMLISIVITLAVHPLVCLSAHKLGLREDRL